MHLKRHSKPYTCTLCGKGFSSDKDKNRHERTHNPSAVRYRCLVDGCLFETGRKDSATRHAWGKHMEVVGA